MHDRRRPRDSACRAAAVVARELKHLASLHNPLFYERQRLRLSTHQTPRLIRCYEEDLTHLHLPRGLLAQLEDGGRERRQPARDRGSAADTRAAAARVPRRADAAASKTAVTAMLAHESGVLVAPPGSGKTVMACALIAERKLPTLILAHSKPLLDQWRAQLEALLGLASKQIGQRGGGRRKLTGVVDLAMIQSLKAIDDLEAFFGGYGLIVVDECHHLPAFSFEAAVRRAPARHFLGLTATPYRRDGLQEIVTMQCGPIRHQIATSEGPAGEIDRSSSTCARPTFAVAGAAETPIQELFRLLVEDEERTHARLRRRDRRARRGQALPRAQPVEGALQRCSPTSSEAEASRRSSSKEASASAHAPRSSRRSSGRRPRSRSSSSRPASTSARASTARSSTPSSSPSPSPSKAASSSTPAGSCAPTKTRRACASTTTQTPRARAPSDAHPPTRHLQAAGIQRERPAAASPQLAVPILAA